MTKKLSFQKEHSFLFENTSINYETIGLGKITLLFIHGFGMTLNSWNEIKYKFDVSVFKLILVDIKGCGFSDKPINSDYSLKTHTRILLGLLQHLKIKKIFVVGHSYGGMIALHMQFYIKKYKADLAINGMVLLDTPGYKNSIPFFIKVLKSPILSFLMLDIIPPRLSAINVIINTFVNKRFAINKYLEKYVFFYRMKGFNSTLKQSAKQVIPVNLEEITSSYKDINVPVLLIWGERDWLVPSSQAKKLKTNIKNANLIIIKDCGHVPHEEKPEITFHHIDQFLRKHTNSNEEINLYY